MRLLEIIIIDVITQAVCRRETMRFPLRSARKGRLKNKAIFLSLMGATSFTLKVCL